MVDRFEPDCHPIRTGQDLNGNTHTRRSILKAGIVALTLAAGTGGALYRRSTTSAENRNSSQPQTQSNDVSPTEVKSYQLSAVQVLTPDTVFGIATVDGPSGWADRRSFLIKSTLQQDGTMLTSTLKGISSDPDVLQAVSASEDGNTVMATGIDRNKDLITYTYSTQANDKNPNWQTGTDPLALSPNVTPDGRYTFFNAASRDEPKNYLLRFNFTSGMIDRRWDPNLPGLGIGPESPIMKLSEGTYRQYIVQRGTLYRAIYTEDQPPQLTPLGLVGFVGGRIVEYNDKGDENLLLFGLSDDSTLRFINEKPAQPPSFTTRKDLYSQNAERQSNSAVADTRPGVRRLICGITEIEPVKGGGNIYRPRLELMSADTPYDLSTHRLVENTPSSPKTGGVSVIGLLHTPDNRVWRFFQAISDSFFDSQKRAWFTSGHLDTRAYVDGQFVGDWRQEVLSIPASQQASQLLYIPMVGRNLIR